ncbi:4-amino-4-deoxy-L-arabinose transferase-like glycosyltransferase [Pedobacter cryoconitis]|uniref:glycosyltransferase family 39 protein n=1 Tax=Pedobacter cryoconitis TaxID=188932 RepID=UPI0016189158|nr:glycosyltransferase family 39 protein [Pedobacter cryoconitis]MBB6269710.1 4-amino-4-deoxy-L-arabinose transferase-like glycosyltransferase [Pedobacter cryoconitis]
MSALDLKITLKKSVFLGLFIVLKIVLSYALVNGAYDFHRDEFLYLDQANHMAAGFTSVPPLISVFSWLIKLLGGGFYLVRFFPAFIGALTIVYCWKIVGAIKGNLLAQCLACTAMICSIYLRLNTLYQPNSFDVLAWTAAFYYLIRYFDHEQEKYLYLFATAIAIGFLNKYNILFLVIGLFPAILVGKERKILASKHLYFAILLALLIALPNILWQINRGFPVMHHMKLLQRTQLVNVGLIPFLFSQLLFFANSIFFLLAGICTLIFYKPFAKYRWIIFTYLFTMLVFIYLHGKDYYTLGLYPVLLCFGAVYFGQVLSKYVAVWGSVLIFMLVSFIYVLPLLMPVYSPMQIIKHRKRFERFGLLRWEDGKNHVLPQDYADMQGWKEIAHLADIAYSRVQNKSTLLVRADNYGQAGAINYYSKFHDIRAVAYSDDYLHWFRIEKPIQAMIMLTGAMDEDPQRKRERRFFKKITKIGEVKSPYSRESGASVFLLEGANINVTSIIESEIIEKQKWQ